MSTLNIERDTAVSLPVRAGSRYWSDFQILGRPARCWHPPCTYCGLTWSEDGDDRGKNAAGIAASHAGVVADCSRRTLLGEMGMVRQECWREAVPPRAAVDARDRPDHSITTPSAAGGNCSAFPASSAFCVRAEWYQPLVELACSDRRHTSPNSTFQRASPVDRYGPGERRTRGSPMDRLLLGGNRH